MRILFHANAPWVASGYGQAGRYFGQALAALGHEVAISAYQGLQGGILEWEGIKVYPAGSTPYGNDICLQHAEHFGADVVVPILDCWVLGPLVDAAAQAKMPLVLWSPIDQAPPPPTVLSIGKRARRFACYSEWGTREMHDHGCETAVQVPLGVDTSIYQPMDKGECKKALGYDEHDFVALIVAANKCPHSRKAWAQQLEGFAMFHHTERGRESRLFIHAEAKPAPGTGWLLEPMLRQYAIADVTTFADPYFCNSVGFTPEQMCVLYNAADVLLAASAGEGFGLPIIEAQACGTPVIIGEWTSMPELFNYGHRIPQECAMRWRAPLGGYWFYPDPDDVRDALFEVHERLRAKPLTAEIIQEKRGKEARRFVQERFEVSKLAKDSLLPVLEQAVGS